MQVGQQIPQSFVARNSLPAPAQQRVPTTRQPAMRRPQQSQKGVATVAAPNKVSCKPNPDAGTVTGSAQKPQGEPQGEPEETTTADAAAAAAPAQHPPVATSSTSGISSTAASLIRGVLRESSPDNGNGLSKASQSNNDPPVAADHSAGTAIVEDRRDRNRNNAKATRVRKKAYVNKLKELVDGLHAERNEDARRRRVAVRHLAEIQDLRRRVVRTFLRNHAAYDSSDRTGWATILEENFWMKQPVTPYRSFRRSEIQKQSRILKGIDAMIRDSASMSVMIESIGSRNQLWLQRKRDEFLHLLNESRGGKAIPRTRRIVDDLQKVCGQSDMPRNIVRQTSSSQHAVSSLSSSSGSGGSSSEDKGHEMRSKRRRKLHNKTAPAAANGAEIQISNDNGKHASFPEHPISEETGDSGNLNSSGQEETDSDNNSRVAKKQHISDYSSSCDDEPLRESNKGSETPASTETQLLAPPQGPIPLSDLARPVLGHHEVSQLPTNIARSGISHDVKPSAIALPNGHPNLRKAPATALPPFAGLGRRHHALPACGPAAASVASKGGDPLVAASMVAQVYTLRQKESLLSGGSLTGDRNLLDDDRSVSSSSSKKPRGIRAGYHINEDDMILTDNVLMCPFLLKSQGAVKNGALAECIMPGMLRATFSNSSKLNNVEMIFDSMGFCQQLERASGNEGMAQIIPNSLETALAPCKDEARAITLANSPHAIVSVNDAWTKMTGYTQLDVEGKMLSMINGERTVGDEVLNEIRSGKPKHNLDSVARGECACSTNIYYNNDGEEFLAFTSSYPLSNAQEETTHILHVYQLMPP